MRLRPDRIDEYPHATTQRYRAEHQSQVAANELGKMSAGSRRTHVQGQDKQDASSQSCGDDGRPPQLPRKMFAPPTVENTIPTEHRHGVRACRVWSFVAGVPDTQLESFIIVRFHSQNHFFVNIHVPAAVEAKTERIIRFADDQSSEGNQRFLNFDLQNYLTTQPIRVSFGHMCGHTPPPRHHRKGDNGMSVQKRTLFDFCSDREPFR
jgi:hypothetical protein